MVTVFVPVVDAFTGNAVKLNVPDTLVDVNVAMVSEPVPASDDADQLPITVVPVVVITFNTVVPAADVCSAHRGPGGEVDRKRQRRIV